MDSKYTYTLAQFPNQKYDTDSLSDQIRESAITVALDYINGFVTNVDIYFNAELSPSEVTILDTVVANHTGEPASEPLPIVRTQILTEALHWVESGDTTQSLYAAESLILDVSAGDTVVAKSFSWPYNIAVKSATIYVTDDMIGDEMVVHEAPNTLVGYLTQPLSVGDTSVYVSESVIDNIRKAYYVGLYVPGEQGIEVGQVLEIDLKTNALKILDPSPSAADVYSYVAMCSKLIPNLLFTTTDKVEIGKTIPTASRLPANIPLRVYYKNNNGKAKKVSIFVEYIY